MAVNKYQKFLYSIELNDKMTNGVHLRGKKVAVPGWSREAPLPVAPNASMVSSFSVPSAKVSYKETGEDFITPAGKMTDKDYNVVHGNIVASPARQAQARRFSGR